MVELLVLRISLQKSNPDLEMSCWFWMENKPKVDDATKAQTLTFKQDFFNK